MGSAEAMPSSSAGVVDRLVGRLGRAAAPLAVVEAAHDLAAQADGVELVAGQVVGQARDAGVHGRPAQLLVGRLLAGGHLHQGRPTQEDLGALLDHDDVVAHARDVGAAGGGVAEDQGHGGHGGGRAPGEVPEGAAPGDEQLGLGREVGPARLDQVDDRQAVLEGDVRGAGALAEGEGVHGAAPHGGVVGADQALDPLDHADADDLGRPDLVLGAPGGQGAQLQEGGVPVEQELDALPGRQLAPLPVALDVALPAAGPGGGQLLVDRCRVPSDRARALARKVSEFGSMVVARTGMGGVGCGLWRAVAGCGVGFPALVWWFGDRVASDGPTWEE